MNVRPQPATRQHPPDGWPAPDPSTRVELDLASIRPSSPAPRGRRRSRKSRAHLAPVMIAAPVVAIDLPSLTGQISNTLAVLRHNYGLAYRSRTWIDEMLPAHGAELRDPALARDLLAAAALDAGGIRADVVALAESHPRDQIVATGTAILGALQNVLAACAVPSDMLPAPLPSDPSSWPATKC